MKSERIHLPSFLGDDEEITYQQLSFKRNAVTSLKTIIE